MKIIDRIKFGLLSPEAIREMSHAEIVVPDTYDRDGYPEEGGLMDPRLGVIDPGIQCESCGKRSGQCKGHFGHIELARPVLHSGFSKDIRKLHLGVRRKFLLSFCDDLRELYEENYLDEEQVEILKNQVVEICVPEEKSFRKSH